MENKIPVMVTTEHKGVFFGYMENDALSASKAFVDLTNARMAVYWSSDIRGVLGLAATGPNENCRIGPKIPKIRLFDVTSISFLEEAVADKWDKIKVWN